MNIRAIWMMVLVSLLNAGCFMLPESGPERDEDNFFTQQIRADHRVAAIIAKKPKTHVVADGNVPCIYVSAIAPLVFAGKDKDGRDIMIRDPESVYTPEEMRILEDVVVEATRMLRIERSIKMLDVDTGRSHKPRKLFRSPYEED